MAGLFRDFANIVAAMSPVSYGSDEILPNDVLYTDLFSTLQQLTHLHLVLEHIYEVEAGNFPAATSTTVGDLFWVILGEIDEQVQAETTSTVIPIVKERTAKHSPSELRRIFYPDDHNESLDSE